MFIQLKARACFFFSFVGKITTRGDGSRSVRSPTSSCLLRMRDTWSSRADDDVSFFPGHFFLNISGKKREREERTPPAHNDGDDAESRGDVGKRPRGAHRREVFQLIAFVRLIPLPPSLPYDVGSIPGETYGGLMVIFCCHAVVFAS